MATPRPKADQSPTHPPKPPRSPRIKPAPTPEVQAESGPDHQRPDRPGTTTVAPNDPPNQETGARQLFQLIQRMIQAPSADTSASAPSIMTALVQAAKLGTTERLTLEEAAGAAPGADPYILVELLSIKVGQQQPAAADTGNESIPSETRTALQLANDLLATPGVWLRTPNPQFGDRRPIDLIDTPDEVLVYNALNAFQYGLF